MENITYTIVQFFIVCKVKYFTVCLCVIMLIIPKLIKLSAIRYYMRR